MPHNKPLWRFLLLAIAAKAVAFALLLIDALNHPTGTLVLRDPSLYFCLAGLLIVASATYDPGSPLRRWTTFADLSLAAALAGAFYLGLQYAMQTPSASAAPTFLLRLFDALDGFTAVFITVRWLGTRRADECRYFSVVAAFVWTDALTAAVHNRLVFLDTYWSELLLPLPFIVLGLGLAQRTLAWPRGVRRSADARIVSQTLLPLLLAIGLYAVTLTVMPLHGVRSRWILVVTVGLYATRAAAVMGYHLSVEGKLRRVVGTCSKWPPGTN